MSETLSVIFDGEVFRPETPVKLEPNTRYEITLQAVPLTQEKDLALEQLFILTDPEEINEFLQANPALVPFLRAAHSTFQTYFPDAGYLARIAFSHLDVFERQLILVISLKKSSEEALTKFNELESNWWLPNSKDKNNKVALVLEYPTSSTNSLSDFLKEISGTYSGPQDWSAEHDYYLHGGSRRKNLTSDE